MAIEIRNDTGLADQSHLSTIEHGTRDERGRFIGSGNPRGRPRKRKLPKLPPAEGLVGKLLEALSSETIMRGPNGSVKLTYIDALIKKLLADLLTGTPADRARLLKQLFQLVDVQVRLDAYKESYVASFAAPEWTDELDERYRVVMSDYAEHDRDEADLRAYLQTRGEDYAQFVAARRAAEDNELDRFG